MITKRTPQQIEHLRRHEYTRTGRTFVDPFLQEYWWGPLATFLPQNINANVISVIGLAFNIVSTVILLYYSPNATAEVPGWACVLAGVNVIIYQTCDALDGRQCLQYTTKRNWHLQVAEIVDHACDSISMVCITTETAICVQLGSRPDLYVALMLSSMFMFFTAHWQTYISGLVRFSLFDVTEAQIFISIVYIRSGIMGHQVWREKILGLEWRELLNLIGCIMAVLKFVSQALFVQRRGHKQTLAGTSMMSPGLHIGTALLLALVTNAATNLYECQPCVFLAIYGLTEAKMSNKLMISYMYQSDVRLLDTILIGPIALIVNHVFDSPIPCHVLLWSALIFCAADLLLYLRRVTKEACGHLHVTCFGSYAKEGEEENHNG